jgi:hypothetical protein
VQTLVDVVDVESGDTQKTILPDPPRPPVVG